MAKRRYIPKPTSNKKVDKPKYPSPFGSHQSMIDEESNEKCNDNKMVVCKDDDGLYVTFKNRLGNGMMDNCRTISKKFRREQLVKVGIVNESKENSE